MVDFSHNKPYRPGWNDVDPNKPINKSKPFPPRNIFVTSPFIVGVLDIRWDNPLEVTENSKWKVQGVNIYRSIDSEIGPYSKLNSDPIETLYYRDNTQHAFVENEDVLPRLSRGENPTNDWYFKVLNKPLIKEGSQNVIADSPQDVYITIDNGDGNLVRVPPLQVRGECGTVFLISSPTLNPVTKKLEPPRLPYPPNGRCYISYWHNINFVRADLYPRYFYKVTTVAKNSNGETIETDLEDVFPTHVYRIEKPDYIWKAIISKNRYLLEQLGERAKLYLRKEVGQPCPSLSQTHQQSHYNCEICYGTGIVGGYEGPYDLLMASPEAEKHIELTDIGLRMNFSFESWTGPSPLLRTRDLVVRQNNERMIIGSVTPQGAKGSVFQQHFMLNYRDVGDIVYKVGEVCSNQPVPVSDDTRGVNQPVTDASPQIPAYKSKRAETEKGRSIQFENVTW